MFQVLFREQCKFVSIYSAFTMFYILCGFSLRCRHPCLEGFMKGVLRGVCAGFSSVFLYMIIWSALTNFPLHISLQRFNPVFSLIALHSHVFIVLGCLRFQSLNNKLLTMKLKKSTDYWIPWSLRSIFNSYCMKALHLPSISTSL